MRVRLITPATRSASTGIDGQVAGPPEPDHPFPPDPGFVAAMQQPDRSSGAADPPAGLRPRNACGRRHGWRPVLGMKFRHSRRVSFRQLPANTIRTVSTSPASATSPSSSDSAPQSLEVRGQAPDRNLALELVRVTEAAALAAARWVGRGDKNGADGAAVDAMRRLVGTVSMQGVVVIGEGEKDEAPMLFNGEEVGDGNGPECDVAVDPVDGTTLTAKGMNNAVSVMAVSERGSMYDASVCFYMDKLVTGPEAADVVDIDAPVADNIAAVAKAKGVAVRDVTVAILERPRHDDLVRKVREAGARVKLLSDGDVAGAVMAANETPGVDLLLGVGGTPEGIITACAMLCLGGTIQAKLWPKDDDERRKVLDAGRDLDVVLHTADLVNSDNVFFVATGITDGELMAGVTYRPGGATTDSLVMRSKSGTIRRVQSQHRLSKLQAYSTVPF